MILQAINSNNHLINHVMNKAIFWEEIKDGTKSLSKMMMQQKGFALKLLNCMENKSNNFSWLNYANGILL